MAKHERPMTATQVAFQRATEELRDRFPSRFTVAVDADSTILLIITDTTTGRTSTVTSEYIRKVANVLSDLFPDE